MSTWIQITDHAIDRWRERIGLSDPHRWLAMAAILGQHVRTNPDGSRCMAWGDLEVVRQDWPGRIVVVTVYVPRAAA